MRSLTKAELKDIETLVEKRGYSRDQAVMAVTAPRRKIRCPTLAELDQLQQQRTAQLAAQEVN
ncbi:hypothetical protein [Sulfitobacter sp.]|uniref:hypothetical protein n=1 Tax=Sulfitobacter sp. TaxID=1903071 RepID=UPI003F6CCA85